MIVPALGSKIGWYRIVYKFISEFHALHIKAILNFSNFKLLNNGSVCAVYLLLVMILIARFCDFDDLSHSNLQEVITNYKWDKIKKEYISFRAEKVK